MHLGNGALSPECALLSASVAAVGLGWATAQARRQTISRGEAWTAGALGAAVFAAQMVNFPVLPYSSGHLVGGVLLAAALRPALGALTMAIILLLQAILLGDGGLAALGANIINMALLPAALVALMTKGRSAIGLGLCALGATVLAAGLISVEVAIGRPADGLPLGDFAQQMLQAHLAIGALEGLLTAAIVSALARTGSRRVQQAALAVASCVLIALIPTASALPDGYEASAERSAWSALLTEAPGDLPSAVAGIASWQEEIASGISDVVPGEIALATVATLVAAALCLALTWAVARNETPFTAS